MPWQQRPPSGSWRAPAPPSVAASSSRPAAPGALAKPFAPSLLPSLLAGRAVLAGPNWTLWPNPREDLTGGRVFGALPPPLQATGETVGVLTWRWTLRVRMTRARRAGYLH